MFRKRNEPQFRKTAKTFTNQTTLLPTAFENNEETNEGREILIFD